MNKIYGFKSRVDCDEFVSVTIKGIGFLEIRSDSLEQCVEGAYILLTGDYSIGEIEDEFLFISYNPRTRELICRKKMAPQPTEVKEMTHEELKLMSDSELVEYFAAFSKHYGSLPAEMVSERVEKNVSNTQFILTERLYELRRRIAELEAELRQEKVKSAELEEQLRLTQQKSSEQCAEIVDLKETTRETREELGEVDDDQW